ncbi:acetyl-CoA carboxylase biotin carboxyl carrier protein [Diaphorobacter ruginosibacter]|jgi:acetyl-CoA carboxylase biotin carboxyl carrier protein|uniref:Biotin carboxyl carrier protein of acetyl-CoA carboxylase n=1 Tax=Diaphorobacter ruginosibacter TaxID=1715720 RepID=A0A7G9RU55_9BURK|nr:acetyl-CoA carboxylase biotin carboxyl carrier protein [Diaphorobacter ruginosibacter]MDR2335473.1 acetyl-CoA carboxylase biotin carboxyl carrier protein [Burkholderiaceae bacterium]QNN59130.1 acetyl-CoA carboxylase biotin carboxyl carrier protein [Diaphorobacter ruginosibacter]
MSFDIEKIKSLIAVAAEAQLDELELSQNGVDVRIQRFADGADVPVAAVQTSSVVQQASTASPSTVAAPAQASIALQILKAPMAGTFYRSVTPGGGALVNAGDSIDAGTVVGVLESMKIMNEIESETQGRVKRVLCDNGELVSAGQPLFEIEEA